MTTAADHPESIGPYEIVRVLGSGGMGVVYEARQASLNRAVALKVIRSGVVSSSNLRRFEYEAEVLAKLQHPGIARIFEAGADDHGEGSQPWFAMEMVSGVSIAEYVHRSAPGIEATLELMALVCNAIHHAHQKGVIHRDIKPGNILVDEHGHPRVLDFGVARSLNAPLQTLHTEPGLIIGTLAYMSPEQAGGRNDDVETRSDVYALGAVLYELLAGRMPLDVSGASIVDAVRTIRETEPERLGTIDRRLRGDIETVVATALAKDKERRYASAEALAADLRRIVNDEPIAARPASATYQLRKFASRHRVLVGAAGMIALVLLIAVGIVSLALVETMQSRRAERDQLAETTAALAEVQLQRDRAVAAEAEAQQEAVVRESILSFLNNDLLGAVAPERMGRDVTVREVVDAAAKALRNNETPASVESLPEVIAALKATLASIYWTLGEHELGAELMQDSIVELSDALGEEHRHTRHAIEDLGRLSAETGNYDLAEEMLTRAVEINRRLHGDLHEDTMSAMGNLMTLHMRLGRIEETERILIEMLDKQREAYGEAHSDTLFTKSNLGQLYLESRRLDEAEPLFREVLAAKRETLGLEHRWTYQAENNLAALLVQQERYAEAELLYQHAIAGEERVLGEGHPDVLPTKYNLAFLYEQDGRLEEAERCYLEILPQCEAALGAEHFGTLRVREQLASIYVKTDRKSKAEPLLHELIKTREQSLGVDNPDTLTSMCSLGSLLRELGRPDEALRVFRDAVQRTTRSHPADFYLRGVALCGLGLSHVDLGESENAETALLEAHGVLAGSLGVEASETEEVVRELIRLYDAQGNAGEAAVWWERLPR